MAQSRKRSPSPPPGGSNSAALEKLLSQVVEVSFTGLSGIVAGADSGLVQRVNPNSQALVAGVQVGWVFQSVDGQPYTLPLLREKAASGIPYVIGFSTASASPRSDAQPRSMSSLSTDATTTANVVTGTTSKAQQDAELLPVPAQDILYTFMNKLSESEKATLLRRLLEQCPYIQVHQWSQRPNPQVYQNPSQSSLPWLGLNSSKVHPLKAGAVSESCATLGPPASSCASTSENGTPRAPRLKQGNKKFNKIPHRRSHSEERRAAQSMSPRYEFVGDRAHEPGTMVGTERTLEPELERDSTVEPVIGSLWRQTPPVLKDAKEHHSLSDFFLAESPITRRPPRTLPETPIVQFSSATYYVKEEEGAATLSVVRIGGLKERSEVHFRTTDPSGEAGMRYKETAQVVAFEPGENTKIIQVPLILSDEWQSDLEFGVELLAEGLVGAELSSLRFSRVKVIDSQAYPSDRFKRALEKQDLSSVPFLLLLWEYCKMNIRSSSLVRNATIKMLAVDMLHNLETLLKLVVNLFLVDYILGTQDDERGTSILPVSDHFGLVLCIILVVVPFAVLHLFEFRKLHWGLAGMLRMNLQKNILRRFLNYTIASRNMLHTGDIFMAMTRDSVDVVHSGYLNVLELVKLVGELCMFLVFNLIVALVFEEPIMWTMLGPLIFFPIVLISILFLRKPMTERAETARNRRQDALLEHVHSCESRYQLYKDYLQRPRLVSEFEAVISEFNQADGAARAYELNNMFAARWLCVLCVAMVTYVVGLRVLDGKQTLGIFLANIRVVTKIGDTWASIYKALLGIQSMFPALDRVVTLMNMPSDLADRMKSAKSHGEETMTYFGRFEHPDDIPFKLEDLSFSFPEPPEEKGVRLIKARSMGLSNQNSYTISSETVLSSIRQSKNLSINGEVHFHQGEFIALVGPHGGGKTTLLQLIGGMLHSPVANGKACIFVPSHLRLLHVSMEPLFFRGTLLDNLRFGIAHGHPNGRLDRIIAICERLGLSDSVMRYIRSEVQIHWAMVLSQTQIHLLRIARGLIANPHILCVHKPALVFDSNTATNVMQHLKAFVTEKGLESEGSLESRRPRTCIITTARYEGISVADRVFLVCSSGMKLLDKNRIRPEDFNRFNDGEEECLNLNFSI